MLPKVSVVITLFNEQGNIKRLINNLNKQRFRDFEVIFVDDGSSDQTVSKLHSSTMNAPHRVFCRSHQGLRPARAFGAEQAHGEIIITLDADEDFNSDLLYKLQTHFRDPRVGAAGGFIAPIGSQWYHKAIYEIALWSFAFREKNPTYRFVFGGCAAYRSKALDEIGGLSTGEIGEDVVASWSMINKGWQIIIDRSILVKHYEHTSFENFTEKMVRDQQRQAVTREKYSTKLPHLLWFMATQFLPHRIQSGNVNTIYAYLLLLFIGINEVIHKLGKLFKIM